jgi:diacylglycerol kinase (ATP)
VRCVLIQNPASGKNRHLREEQLRKILETLSERGYSAEVWATTGPGSATMQARKAAASGADIVFACGGDGTVNEIVQGLVSETREPATALGILPLGSANALARHLCVSMNPSIAVLQQIDSETRVVSVGKVVQNDQPRYFTIMAGAGPDGALASKVSGAHKSSLGRLAYYLHAGQLFFTQRFHPFEVRCGGTSSDGFATHRAVAVMAARIGNLGGLFSKLTDRQASIDDDHLRVLIVAPPAAISLPLWFILGWLNLHRLNPLVSFLDVTEFSCCDHAGVFTHVQVDGEWAGYAPMQVSIVHRALRLCVPLQKKSAH